MAEALGHPRLGYYRTRPAAWAPPATSRPRRKSPRCSASCWAPGSPSAGWRWAGPPPVQPRRAGPRPRHLDGRCAARHARRAGLPRRARPASRRDQRAAARRAASGARPASRRPGTSASTTCRPARSLLVANEFFDALPVRQFEKTPRGWAERMVGLAPDGETLRLGAGARRHAVRAVAARCAGRRAGRDLRSGPRARRRDRRARSARDGGWALIVDYGYESGDQAPRCRPCAAIAAPASSTGPARPTSARMSISPPCAAAAGAPTFGPVAQGDFLRRLGIVQRAETLKARADEAQRGAIDAALARLIAPDQMGTLFRVLAVGDGRSAAPAGFSEPPDMIEAPHACRPRRRARIASSPAAAASAPASIRRSTAATARAISSDNVRENRRRAAGRFGRRERELLTVHQIHSTDVLTVARAALDLARRAQGRCAGDRPAGRRAGRAGRRLRAGAAGRCRGAGVIGAAHAGWKGALAGVVEADDRRHGEARRAGASACAPRSVPASAATPTRSGRSSPRRSSRRTRPTRASSAHAPRAGHFLFDLAGYLTHRIAHGRRRGRAPPATTRWPATRRFLQLSPQHAAGRARLWTGPVGDRAQRTDVPYLIILVFCCLLGMIATCVHAVMRRCVMLLLLAGCVPPPQALRARRPPATPPSRRQAGQDRAGDRARPPTCRRDGRAGRGGAGRSSCSPTASSPRVQPAPAPIQVDRRHEHARCRSSTGIEIQIEWYASTGAPQASQDPAISTHARRDRRTIAEASDRLVSRIAQQAAPRVATLIGKPPTFQARSPGQVAAGVSVPTPGAAP